MVYSYFVGWAVVFVFAIILLFFMGDPAVALNTPAGWVRICVDVAEQSCTS